MSANAQGTPAAPETSGSVDKANGQAASNTDAPTNGGISLLMVATAAYTSRKMAKMNATKNAVI